MRLSWPESGSAGLRLEEATALAAEAGGVSWVPVNATAATNNGIVRVELPLVAGNRFYRLHTR